MNNTIQEKMELIASMIEAEERNLQLLKSAFNELMLLQKNVNSTAPTIKTYKDYEEIIFEKVFLLYHRYSDLRFEAKKHKISMVHLGGISTFGFMYSEYEKYRNSANPSTLATKIKRYWFHGRNGRMKKPKKHEIFEKLPLFQQLLDTPNELITNKMLDAIILEDLVNHNASDYKGFNEFVSLMEH